jgi:hypothetical protein
MGTSYWQTCAATLHVVFGASQSPLSLQPHRFVPAAPQFFPEPTPVVQSLGPVQPHTFRSEPGLQAWPWTFMLQSPVALHSWQVFWLAPAVTHFGFAAEVQSVASFIMVQPHLLPTHSLPRALLVQSLPPVHPQVSVAARHAVPVSLPAQSVCP